MRRPLGLVLVALGAFFLVLAPLSRWYVEPRLAVAPLNCTGESAVCHAKVSRSPSAGQATAIFNSATLSSFPGLPIDLTSDRTVAADVVGSQQAHHTIYDESLVTAATIKAADGTESQLGVDTTTARVVFDGHTSKLIDCCGANANGAPMDKGAVGAVMPYKFGFDTQPKDTSYFDTVLNKALAMKYEGKDTINGLAVYKFVQTIPATQYDIVEVPRNLVGGSDDSAFKAGRTYANIRTVWVEPVTGAIVKGQEQINEALLGPDGQPHLTVLAATLTFTPDNIAQSVKIAKDGKAKLQLLRSQLPVGGLIGGLLLVGVGIGLLRRRGGAPSPTGSGPPAVVHA